MIQYVYVIDMESLRDEVNFRINGLLGLSSRGLESLPDLIEEAQGNHDIVDLIQEWLIVEQVDLSRILEIKLWLSLSYDQLARIFDTSHKEITKMMRTTRQASLPPYHVQQSEQVGGDWSCFLVEQYLSPWLDGEVDHETSLQSLQSHLSGCLNCQMREVQYRDLNRRIIARRPQFPAIQESFWNEKMIELRTRRRWMVGKWVVSLTVITLLSILGVVSWISTPKKIPNIYEIDETL